MRSACAISSSFWGVLSGRNSSAVISTLRPDRRWCHSPPTTPSISTTGKLPACPLDSPRWAASPAKSRSRGWEPTMKASKSECCLRQDSAPARPHPVERGHDQLTSPRPRLCDDGVAEFCRGELGRPERIGYRENDFLRLRQSQEPLLDRCRERNCAQSCCPEGEVLGRQQVNGAAGSVRLDQASLVPQAPTDLLLGNAQRAYPGGQLRGRGDLGVCPAHGPHDIGRAAVPGGRDKPVPLQPPGADLSPRKRLWLPNAHPCSVPSTPSRDNGARVPLHLSFRVTRPAMPSGRVTTPLPHPLWSSVSTGLRVVPWLMRIPLSSKRSRTLVRPEPTALRSGSTTAKSSCRSPWFRSGSAAAPTPNPTAQVLRAEAGAA